MAGYGGPCAPGTSGARGGARPSGGDRGWRVVEEPSARKTDTRRWEVGRSSPPPPPLMAIGTPDSRRVAWTTEVGGASCKVAAARRRVTEEAGATVTTSWLTGEEEREADLDMVPRGAALTGAAASVSTLGTGGAERAGRPHPVIERKGRRGESSRPRSGRRPWRRRCVRPSGAAARARWSSPPPRQSTDGGTFGEF